MNKTSVYFKEFIANTGFDEWATPRWMSVRNGTTNQMGVVIKNDSYAKGLAFVSTNKSVMDTKMFHEADPFLFLSDAYSESDSKAFVYDVAGKSVGAAVIKAIKTGNKGAGSVEVNRLDVEARPSKGYKVDFFFLENSVGDKPSATIANVDAILRDINVVYEPQANVTFTRGATQTIGVQSTNHVFGDAEEEQAKIVVDASQPTGDKYVILTWRIDGSRFSGHNVGGYAGYYDAYVFSGAYGTTHNKDILVHELGHSLGLIHQPRDAPEAKDTPLSGGDLKFQDMVMYPFVGGSRFRKTEIQHLNTLTP